MRYRGDADAGEGQAQDQLQALTQSTDTPQAPVTPPSTDAPKPYDAPWAERVLGGSHGIEDFKGLTETDLQDEETRNWINRKIRKKREADSAAAAAQVPAAAPAAKAAEPAASPVPAGGGGALGAAPPVAGYPAGQPGPSVLRSGRLPMEPVFQAPVQQPVNGGWIPAQNGLWWPPYPQTGGPIPLPSATHTLLKPASAQAQLAMLEG